MPDSGTEAIYAFNSLPCREVEGVFVGVRLVNADGTYYLTVFAAESKREAVRFDAWLYSAELDYLRVEAEAAITRECSVYSRWHGPKQLFALVSTDAVKLARHPTHPLDIPAVRAWVGQAALRLRAEALGEL